MTTTTLFILNDGPYDSERAYNALRLAGALAGREDQSVQIFLLGNAVACVRTGQKVPEGYYNLQLMLGRVARQVEVAVGGTCMDARGLRDADLIQDALRSILAQLADWIATSDKVLVFLH